MARIIHLSDVHFGGEDASAAEAALGFVHETPPDLVMVTGDLTLNGLPREFTAARAWLDRLPQPMLCTPGNHDTPYWNIPLRALVPFQRYRRYIGSPNTALFNGAGIAARMINSSRGAQPRPDWSKGAIRLATAHADVTAFDAAPPRSLRVIGCHHPLVEVADTPVTGGVRRGAVAAAIFAEGGVDVILSGHVHNPFAIALPYGDSLTYAVGAGTLSIRTRGTPPSFNVLDIEDDTVTVSAIGWTGERLEPLQSWTLERRQAAKPSTAPISA